MVVSEEQNVKARDEGKLGNLEEILVASGCSRQSVVKRSKAVGKSCNAALLWAFEEGAGPRRGKGHKALWLLSARQPVNIFQSSKSWLERLNEDALTNVWGIESPQREEH